MAMERMVQKVHPKMQRERKQTSERKRTPASSLPRQKSRPPDRRTNDTYCTVTFLRSELVIIVDEDKQLKQRISPLVYRVHREGRYHSLPCMYDGSLSVIALQVSYRYYRKHSRLSHYYNLYHTLNTKARERPRSETDNHKGAAQCCGDIYVFPSPI